MLLLAFAFGMTVGTGIKAPLNYSVFSAAGGALLATMAWYGAVFGFKWSVQEGIVNYQLVYGSLATVVLTLIWIYVSSLILLFGAHLSAAIAHRRNVQLPKPD